MSNKKVAMRVNVSEVILMTDMDTELPVDVNEMRTQWIVVDLVNEKTEVVPGDQDPFSGTPY